jgi:N-acetyl-anhydromuramyl-L-alanine amidase AmpD
MKFRDLLLDSNNSADADGATVGSLVVAGGKESLWNDRPAECRPDVIVMHYMSAEESVPDDPFRHGAILRRFCTCIVSSHYLIDRQGIIFRLVPEEKRAWHCGGSIMPEPDNRQNVNDFSIGIELVGTDSSGFTDKQYQSAAMLCKDIRMRHGHDFRIVGHEHIAGERAVSLGLRSMAKIDPGPLFTWIKIQDGAGTASK